MAEYEPSLDTKRYLKHIGNRVTSYYNTMERAKTFILDEGITDRDIVMNCIIMSVLWLAAVREETLTEDQLFMFLGLEEELADKQEELSIADDMKEWGLDEVLIYVVENY